MKTKCFSELRSIGFLNALEALLPFKSPCGKRAMSDAEFSMNGRRSSADCR